MTDPKEPTNLHDEFEAMLQERADQLTDHTTDNTRHELEAAAKRSTSTTIGR